MYFFLKHAHVTWALDILLVDIYHVLLIINRQRVVARNRYFRSAPTTNCQKTKLYFTILQTSWPHQLHIDRN